MLRVFTALVTECKILLLSSSFTHLTMAAEALVALLYPLTFKLVHNYIYIFVVKMVPEILLNNALCRQYLNFKRLSLWLETGK